MLFISTSSLRAKSLPLSLLLVVLLVEKIHASCNIALNNKNDECLANCIGKHSSSNWFADTSTTNPTFICDKTVPWLHHYSAHSSEWIPATPPPGTGVHEYAVFEGSNPPCAANGKCPGCANPVGHKHICSVFIDPVTCKVTCPASSATTSSSSSDGGDTSGSIATKTGGSSKLAAATTLGFIMMAVALGI